MLATASSSTKDAALHAAADLLVARTAEILDANTADVDRAESAGVSATVVDRLRLTAKRIEAMADGLRMVAALPDPIGEVTEGWTRPNGLAIEKVRVPLGVVAIIYENRPNVTSDAFGLCLKAGNAAFLRGSSGAISSNIAIASALREGLAKAGLPEDCLILVEDTSHTAAAEFMQLRNYVDCLIPRGGPSLIASVLANATVPYVIDGDGNCHVYVDEAADLDQALDILVNAKTQRPSVCNAAESLVVHGAVATEFLPRAVAALDGVELVGDERSQAIAPEIGAATEADFSTEFLDLKLSVAVVDDLDAAIAHVNRHGTGHTEAICTRDLVAARRFTREVDAAAVIVERVHPLHRRRDVRLRRRDRDLHPKAPRPGSDGPPRADHPQVRGHGRRPDPHLDDGHGRPQVRVVGRGAGGAGIRRLPGRRRHCGGGVAGRPARQAGAGGGAGGHGQDGAGQVGRRMVGRTPHPPPVLRGPRRVQGPLRVELPQAAPPHPGRAVDGFRPRKAGMGCRRGRHLLRGLPARPSPPRSHPGGRAGRPAHRRGRPGGGGDGGPPAGGALRLAGLDPRVGDSAAPPASRSSSSPRIPPATSRRR